MKKNPAAAKTKAKANAPDWTNAIPVKFEPTDFAWLELLGVRSGLKRSPILRRALRLLAKEAEARPGWNWQQETARAMPPLTPEQQRELAGDAPAANFAETNARARAAAEREQQEKLREAEEEATRLEEAAAAARDKAERLRR